MLKRLLFLFITIFSLNFSHRALADCNNFHTSTLYLTTSNTSFDMDHDGTLDIYISLNFTSSTGTHFNIYGLNGTLVRSNLSGYVVPLDYYDKIDTGAFVGAAEFVDSIFPFNVAKYVGLKIKHNGATCCAWLRVRCDVTGYFYFEKEPVSYLHYCYSSNSNTCISAGELSQSSGVEDFLSKEEPITVSYTGQHIEIGLDNPSHLSLYNIEGKEVFIQNTKEKKIEIDKQILSKGYYMLVVQDANNPEKKHYKKIIVY